MFSLESAQSSCENLLDRLLERTRGIVAALYRCDAAGGYAPVLWRSTGRGGTVSYVSLASDLAVILRSNEGAPLHMSTSAIKDDFVRLGFASFGIKAFASAPVPMKGYGTYHLTVGSDADLDGEEVPAVSEAAEELGTLLDLVSLQAQVRGEALKGFLRDEAGEPGKRTAGSDPRLDACSRLLSCTRSDRGFSEIAALLNNVCDSRGVLIEDASNRVLAQAPAVASLQPSSAWLAKVARLPFMDLIKELQVPVAIPAEYDEQGVERLVIPLFSDGEMLGTLSVLGMSASNVPHMKPVLRTAQFACILLLRSVDASRGKTLRRVLNLVENDRLRIACDLHDETSQDLVALKVRLATASMALSKGDASTAAGILDDCACLIDEILDSVNRLSSDLRPSELNYLGFHQAIEAAAQSKLGRAQISYEFVDNARAAHLSAMQESALLHGVTEALSNCAKHSHASNVRIAIEDDGSWLTVSVSDDGCGFDTSEYVTGADRSDYGMKVMNDCAEAIGGTFWIGSTAGVGTTVRFSIPGRLLGEDADE